MEESRQIEITVLGWAFNQVGKMPISHVSVPELKPRLCFGFRLPVNVQCWREKVMVHLLDLSPSEETCTESSVPFQPGLELAAGNIRRTMGKPCLSLLLYLVK